MQTKIYVFEHSCLASPISFHRTVINTVNFPHTVTEDEGASKILRNNFPKRQTYAPYCFLNDSVGGKL